MKVCILTDADGELVGVYSNEKKALEVADYLEAEHPDLYPLDSLCVEYQIVHE
jgi:hypothetical protein